MIPAIAMEIAESTSPTPIRWSCLIPVGIPVNLRASGTKMRSYIGMRRAINTRGMTGSDGPGTRKPRSRVSIVTLCWTEKVWSCAKHVFMKTVLRMMGSIRRRILVSSTCVTLHKFHGPGKFNWDELYVLVKIAARSKNLLKVK